MNENDEYRGIHTVGDTHIANFTPYSHEKKPSIQEALYGYDAFYYWRKPWKVLNGVFGAHVTTQIDEVVTPPEVVEQETSLSMYHHYANQLLDHSDNEFAYQFREFCVARGLSITTDSPQPRRAKRANQYMRHRLITEMNEWLRSSGST